MKYSIGPVESPWGDYGDILCHGMSMHLPRKEGKIQLERCGPEIFPITFPIDVIVTDAFRKEFESSSLTGATFTPVIKSRIVDLDWSLWDILEDEPPIYPDSGEPSDFLLEREHSEEVSNSLGPLWELTASTNHENDLHYKNGTKIMLLSEKARNWFLEKYSDFVELKDEG